MQTFERGLEYIKNLPSKPQPGQPQLSNQDKLDFYGLFKQATAGENNTKAPSRLKMIEKMKWQAWKKLGSMSKEQAMQQYVKRLTKLMPNWNTSAKL